MPPGKKMQTGFAFSKFADRLSKLAELSTDDMSLLAAMPSAISHYASHETVLRAGEHTRHCCLLLQGYLCWRSASCGQIISIHVPGDIPDLSSYQLQPVGADLASLGTAVVALVPHPYFREISARSPNLSRALFLLTLADASALQNWVVNLGSRDALTRVAHLVCDIAARLWAMGLAKDLTFPSPFTQADLASICGISPVHANRVVQELRRKGVLQWEARTIVITEWHALARIANFRPDYLLLRNAAMVLPGHAQAELEQARFAIDA